MTTPTAMDLERAAVILPAHPHLQGGVAQALASERARNLAALLVARNALVLARDTFVDFDKFFRLAGRPIIAGAARVAHAGIVDTLALIEAEPEPAPVSPSEGG